MKSINTTWTIWTARVVVVVLTTGANVIHRQAESIAIFPNCLPGEVATKTRNKRNVFSTFAHSIPRRRTPSHSHSLPFNHWGRVDGVFLGAGVVGRLLVVNSCRSLKIAVCSSFSLPSPRIHSSFYSGVGRSPRSPGTPMIGTARCGGPAVCRSGSQQAARHHTINAAALL